MRKEMLSVKLCHHHTEINILENDISSSSRSRSPKYLLARAIPGHWRKLSSANETVKNVVWRKLLQRKYTQENDEGDDVGDNNNV